MSDTFQRGDRVIWHTGPGGHQRDGVIDDGPFQGGQFTEPAYVVLFLSTDPTTARLIWQGALRLNNPERWEACPGEHRRGQYTSEWQRKVTAS